MQRQTPAERSQTVCKLLKGPHHRLLQNRGKALLKFPAVQWPFHSDLPCHCDLFALSGNGQPHFVRNLQPIQDHTVAEPPAGRSSVLNEERRACWWRLMLATPHWPSGAPAHRVFFLTLPQLYYLVKSGEVSRVKLFSHLFWDQPVWY